MSSRPSTSPQSILLAKAHPLVRRGLGQLITDALHPCRIREAASTRSLLDAIHESVPDLLILDISLPGPGGLEVLKSVRRLLTLATPVIVLSSHLEPEFALCTLAAGAQAVVLTEHSDDELLQAIEATRRGEVYVSPALLTTRSTLAVLSPS